MRKRATNVAASVRARLLKLARESGRAMDALLTRYALERLLYRLSLSPHRERFVLKGAMLMTTWIEDPYRATRDADLLAFGDAAPEAMLAAFRDICAIPADDGVEFAPDTLRIEAIRQEIEYGGARLRTVAMLAGARIPIVIDVGFGDAVEPAIETIQLPVLLDMPSPKLRAYPREAVVAEKFQAMVALGRANSRMKDFYDVWMLLNAHDFDGDRLACALAATFERRKTELPRTAPDALTADFAMDATKQRLWAAFADQLEANVPALDVVVNELARRLLPVAAAAAARAPQRGPQR